MKTIHLIRHAKSSWASPSLPDVERPLNDIGRECCQLMAPAIVEAGCDFNNVFCSIATRAQQTIQAISEARPERKITWKIDPALYTFSTQGVMSWLQQLDDDLKEIVIVGHNPAFTGICNQVGNQPIDNLSTCGYAQIKVPVSSWKELAKDSGTTIKIITPKMLQ
jgi:phosphohistidine phosphatase